VSRIANKTINKRIETKHTVFPTTGTPITMTDRTMYVHNPTYNVFEGVGDNERIGRKIQNGRLQISFQFDHLGTDLLNNVIAADSYLRMLVLSSTRIHIPTSSGFDTNPPGLTSVDVFYDGAKPHYSPVDRNKWTVHMDKVFHPMARVNSVLTDSWISTSRRRINIRWPRNMTYYQDTQSSAQSLLTGREMYLVFVASFPNAAAVGERIGRLAVSGQFFYKDA